jgi:flagellar hook-length control protein FliK
MVRSLVDPQGRITPEDDMPSLRAAQSGAAGFAGPPDSARAPQHERGTPSTLDEISPDPFSRLFASARLARARRELTRQPIDARPPDARPAARPVNHSTTDKAPTRATKAHASRQVAQESTRAEDNQAPSEPESTQISGEVAPPADSTATACVTDSSPAPDTASTSTAATAESEHPEAGIQEHSETRECCVVAPAMPEDSSVKASAAAFVPVAAHPALSAPQDNADLWAAASSLSNQRLTPGGSSLNASLIPTGPEQPQADAIVAGTPHALTPSVKRETPADRVETEGGGAKPATAPGSFDPVPAAAARIRAQLAARPVPGTGVGHDTWRPAEPDSVSELARVIRSGGRDGQSKMVLRLDPPELGQVRIDVRMDQQALTLRMEAQTPGGHDALHSRLTELRSALEQQGIQVQSVDVTLRPAPGNGAPPEHGWQQQHGSQHEPRGSGHSHHQSDGRGSGGDRHETPAAWNGPASHPESGDGLASVPWYSRGVNLVA